MARASSGNGWGVYLDWQVASETETTITYNFQAGFYSEGYNYQITNTVYWNLDGQAGNSGAVYVDVGVNGSKQMGSGQVKCTKSNNPRTATFTAEINRNDAGWRPGDAKGTWNVTIPARPYYAPSDPSISASNPSPHYGESITLTWGKASNQGNANFDHFEVNYEYPFGSGKYSSLLYNGTKTSLQVTPSDVTGATGGKIRYIVHEVHEWYGSYPFSQNYVDVTVTSGVISAYDADSKRHTGLVTAYDADGKAHNVLITAYDEEGKPHSVV